MDLQEIHNLIDDLADKDQLGYFSPEEKDRYLDRGSLWLFNDFKRQYAQGIDVYEALAPFKTELDYTTSGQGVYTVATNQNYVQLLGMDVSVVDAGTGQPRRWPVDIIREDELPARRNSQLLAPSSTRPIGIERASGSFKLYPEQVHAGTMRFFRRPVAPVFSYTQSGREIVYDVNTSTQLEWTEPYVNKVVLKALMFMGINLDNAMLQQVGLALPQNNV